MADLKAALAQKAGVDPNVPATTEKKPLTLREGLVKLVPHIRTALPDFDDKKANRLVRAIMTEMSKNPDIGSCTVSSVYGAAFNCAALDVIPGPAGEAYLIPFRNNKKPGRPLECTFILGYKGMNRLVRRSGEVIGSPQARVVYTNDKFRYGWGVDDFFEHIPWHMREDEPQDSKGTVRGAYAIIRYKAGGFDIWYMPIAEIEEHRERSLASEKGPWKTDYEAMCKKTAVRAAFAWMPMSADDHNKAMQVDEGVTNIDTDTLDVDFTVTDPDTGESRQVHAGKLGEDVQDAEIKEHPPVKDPPQQTGFGAGKA